MYVNLTGYSQDRFIPDLPEGHNWLMMILPIYAETPPTVQSHTVSSMA